MKRQSILAWIIVITAATSVYSADWQLDWIDGENIPASWDWGIYPSPLHFPPSSHPPGTVPFSGPTGVFSNDCFAEADLGGTPTITIDPAQKTIELWFQPPEPNRCLAVYEPVCGLNGWFGPLSEGDWLFYSNQIPSPYGSFQINFHIDYPLTSPCMYSVLGDWNGDCYADFGDYSLIAALWNVPGGTDINDLASFVQYWLDCSNPLDPSCNIGGATPDFPADGTVIPGDVVTYGGIDYVWTKLIFIPRLTAVEHKGYFNEDYSKVESRAEDANLGSPPYAHVTGWEYVFFAGNPQVPPADDSLVRGQKYYWTVDATDALGNTFAGDIWEFAIQGFYAFEPSPPNEATFISTTPFLSWLPGFGVEDHDIYMGSNWEDVNNAVFDAFDPPPEFVTSRVEPNYQVVTALPNNTKFYWRVDQVQGRAPPFFIPTDLYKGDVWCFTTTPSALSNDGFINFKDYAIPSNYRQTGPILPADIRKDDVVDYIN